MATRPDQILIALAKPSAGGSGTFVPFLEVLPIHQDAKRTLLLQNEPNGRLCAERFLEFRKHCVPIGLGYGPDHFERYNLSIGRDLNHRTAPLSISLGSRILPHAACRELCRTGDWLGFAGHIRG